MRLRALPAGRRAKWVVLAVWLVAAGALGQLQADLQEATTNDPATFLPADAESTQVQETLRTRFRSGRTAAALVVYRRDAGLTAADVAVAEAAVGGLSRASPLERSPDGTTAVSTVLVPASDIDEIRPAVERIRDVIGDSPPPGLGVWVTGPAAVTVDAVEVFGQIDVVLLAATASLVLALLLAIYRSPVVALVPLVVVATAYAIAAGVVYLLIDAFGLVVNGQTTGILIILMFGAGTDYCLLIVSRFREELRRYADAHGAMAAALERTSPAVLSSGATVVGALLVLLLADLATFRSAGPVLAIGVATTTVAGLTLLPALLAIVGRRAFWPFVPRPGGDEATSRFWRGVARRVERKPVAVLAATLVALGVASAGNAVDLPGLSLGAGFRGTVESVEGFDALARAFPAGDAAPTDVLVPSASAEASVERLQRVDGVESVRRVATSTDGRLAQLQVALAFDPYGDRALGVVPRLRDAEPAALVGGPTAEEADTRATTRDDERRVVPVTLLVILFILVVLLRAVVAPLYLVLSVVLSFAATMGASYAAFRWLFDAPGSDASLPLFVFLFVVALGVDYNIFLMTRAREDTHRLGSRRGMLEALERTGAVITSAGVILAGTFAVLTLLPLEQLFQLGFAVALGVLVDTLVVRTLLVPAIAVLLGPRSWWPARISLHGEPARAGRAARGSRGRVRRRRTR